MDPDWNDAIPSWRQPKTPQTASSGKAARAKESHVRQWATVPSASGSGGGKTSTPMAASRTGSSPMRNSVSTPGLATIGPGRFNVSALHDVIKQREDSNKATAAVEHECDDFFRNGLGIPEQFQGDVYLSSSCHTYTQHDLRAACVIDFAQRHMRTEKDCKVPELARAS